jgi:DNA-directed RNA polymerase alpha subunit
MTRDDELLDAPLSVLRLSIRALNSLRNNAIHSVRDLAAKTEAELLELPQLGGKSLEEIKARLRERGLILGQDPGPQRGEQTPSVPERLARIEAQLEALTALVMTLVRKESPDR